jgi:hypothetical protein
LFPKPHQISVHAFLSSDWSVFPSVHSQQAFGTGGYQKAGTSSLKRVTGRKFTISKWFHKSKQKLQFGFLSQKDKKNWENHRGSFKKFYVSISRNFKTNIHLVTIPLVRHVTGNDQDYLGESPEWLFRYLLLL